MKEQEMKKKAKIKQLLSLLAVSVMSLVKGYQIDPGSELKSFFSAASSQSPLEEDEHLFGVLSGVSVSNTPQNNWMLNRGKAYEIITNLINVFLTPRSYIVTHGESVKFFNGSTLSFTQEVKNTKKILFSAFADRNAFFLVTQKAPGEDIHISSYFLYKYSKNITFKSEITVPQTQGVPLNIINVTRFGDTKIFYIFARETSKDQKTDNWVYIEYHGFSNKILHTYKVPREKNELNYNTADAMPSNNYDNYTYSYLVQGLQDPYVKKNLSKINLRITVIKRSSPTYYYRSKVYKLDFRERIDQKNYELVGQGYYFTPTQVNKSLAYDYYKQYAALILKKPQNNTSPLLLRINKINITFNESLDRLQVGLTLNQPETYSPLSSCRSLAFISQVGKSQIVAFCRDPKDSTVEIKYTDYESILVGASIKKYSPLPALKLPNDANVDKYGFITIHSSDPLNPNTFQSMMLLKYSSLSLNCTRVLTTPFKPSGVDKYIWLTYFDGYTDFLMSYDSHNFFVVKEKDGRRFLSLGQLANTTLMVDLEKFKGNEYIEAISSNSKGEKVSRRFPINFHLTDDVEKIWNSALDDQGGPPPTHIDTSARGIYKVDDQIYIGSHFF